MIVTDKGIAATKARTGDKTSALQPPEVFVTWPLAAEFHTSWGWHDDRQKPEFGDRFEMWGALPVKTPTGEAQGYVVLQKITDGSDPKLVAGTVESHIVPGLGTVSFSTQCGMSPSRRWSLLTSGTRSSAASS